MTLFENFKKLKKKFRFTKRCSMDPDNGSVTVISDSRRYFLTFCNIPPSSLGCTFQEQWDYTL